MMLMNRRGVTCGVDSCAPLCSDTQSNSTESSAYYNDRPPCSYFTVTYLAHIPSNYNILLLNFHSTPVPCRFIPLPACALALQVNFAADCCLGNPPSQPNERRIVYETNFFYALGGDISRTRFSFLL
jgi:hypothetical protein